MSAIAALFSNEQDQGHLKAELQNLRRKGALRPSADWDNTGPDPDRSCGRCRVELGRVINRGAFCRACRLKVCKSCREYSFRATDWVCTVCHKHMEIQAASGEWMNEFVRRPSRRRDNRVYVPAADIIKRTIRRSWTISNPTPPWNSSRKAPEMRPYNSLPRGQDIADFPSLQRNDINTKNQLSVDTVSPSSSPKKPSLARRTQSEDIYSEKINSYTVDNSAESSPSKSSPNHSQKSPRINPLILYAQKDKLKTSRRKTGKITKNSDEPNNGNNCDVTDEPAKVSTNEKRVSFDEFTEEIPQTFPTKLSNTNRASSLTDSQFRSHHLTKQTKIGENVDDLSFSSIETTSCGAIPKDENNKEFSPLELCDIETLSGTVFRKVTTVRKRRHDIKRMSAIDNNGRRLNETELHPDIFTPESDDYKLVFLSSDSSSKEEDIDDNDSSTSASSFPIDECDWDYFEPGVVTKSVLSWSSPFGSPRGYRRNLIESPVTSPLVYRRKNTTSHRESDTGTDDDIRLDTGSPASSDSFITKSKDSESSSGEVIMEDVTLRCKHKEVEVQASSVPPCRSCGAPTQYIPIPVPVPIPVPIPALWTSQEAIKFYGSGVLNEAAALARLRIFPRNLWPFLNNQNVASAALNNVWPLMGGTQTQQQYTGYYQESESGSDEPVVPEVYNETVTTMKENNNNNDDDDERNNESNSSLYLQQQIPDENEQISGYLESENRPNDSCSCSSETSDSDEEYVRKTCRIYNVNGRDGDRESDDALPSSNLSSCEDEDEAINQSQRDADIMTSSCSEDSDSDDTGTDQKSKKFSKVFVVNKNEDSPTQRSSESETSDNDTDTDTELDCSVILQNIKYINVDDEPIIDTKDCEKTETVQYEDENSEKDESGNVQYGKNDSIVAETVSGSSSPRKLEDDENFSGNEKIRSVAFREVGEFDQQLSTITTTALSSSAPSSTCCCSPGPGVSVTPDQSVRQQNAARYKSLVMITQEQTTEIGSSSTNSSNYEQVCVVTSDTTTFVNDNNVVVKHTNWQKENGNENPDSIIDHSSHPEGVTVITGGGTLSAFEEGLADDDSWVENISHDEEDFGPSSITTEDSSSSGDEVTLTCSVASVIDNEDELRGYHRAAIDFTLHTIVEESCEESEVEQSNNFINGEQQMHHRESATDLEKYFFFGLGDGTNSLNTNRGEDAFSETSSIYSEGLDSLSNTDEQQQQQNENSDQSELASSRLEKYFLSGFMGFNERRDSDGSVGSDSEGKPSPEQRRKRLVRARGTGRSHSNSLDNILIAASNPELSNNDGTNNETSNDSENSSSSNSETEENTTFEKGEGQFDTVKRKKSKKKDEHKNLETTQEINEDENSECDQDDGKKTPQPITTTQELNTTNLVQNNQQQSRDSGFIGSCDDLLKEQNNGENKNQEIKLELENIEEKKEEKILHTLPPATALTRKDSFNNWSSDEETNLMMCKMRQFFKTMIANSSKTSSSPNMNHKIFSNNSPSPSPRTKRCKPPQLVYFENELTRLMKTVPGIRDDQVREIVEYLSSEDTWSDSYDSSDYTSSDLESTTNKSALQKQISDSCKQIINKFDVNVVDDEEGDEGDGGIIDEKHLNKETALVYQKLVASFEKMATTTSQEADTIPPNNSPPLIAKVMHHIGSRLVALMHEVSSGESQNGNSPKAIRHYHHRRLQQKLSNASSTTTDDDATPELQHDALSALEDNIPYSLPRSKSHDLLNKTNQTGSGEITVEEREASDCERFSWRGSFESALLATDSRNRLSIIGSEGSASASALAIAAKRRSAGDLIFSHKSLSREQLDRVRSCGSIGGASSEDKLWISTSSRPNRRRSSVPDAAASCGSGGSADGEDDDDETNMSSTIRNNLQNGTTNSLPRLPTNTSVNNSMLKAQSHHFLPQNVKSARYRPPGFNRLTTVPKRAVSAPGLQPSHQRRGRRSQQNVPSDDAIISEAHSSPTLGTKSGSKNATPSPIITAKSRSGTISSTNSDWQNAEGDIDRLMALQGRSSLSSLGLRSDSMASVYSGAGEGRYGTVTVRGQVEFGLQYNYKAGDLLIHIKQCKDLAPVDTKRNRSDPYVKVYLLPDKSKSGKRKTKVKKHTLNPVFDETLKFHISLNGLETRTLWLTVWHSDMFGRNDFLGEVMMTLENKVFDDPTPISYNLQERTEPFDDTISFKGDIIVCLKFVPPDMTIQKKGKRSRGTLHVLVKEAKCLTAYKANGTSDPFCKSYLLPDKGRNSKQKTQVMKKTVNPVWNHTFVYDDVTLQELAERCLELTVWDHDRLASNEFLGGVRFSLGTGKHYNKSVEWMDSTGKEISLWKSMLERPNFWVEGCLSLRPTLEARSS